MTDFLLREVFNEETVDRISSNIKNVYSEFDSHKFENKIKSKLHDLSFADRSILIRDTLAEFLPGNFKESVKILVSSLGPPLEMEELTGYDGFYVMPLSSYVAKYGIEYPDISLDALAAMTIRFSSEGPIRPFLRKYPKKVFERLWIWYKDPNAHLRRLVSEGTRPRLPLAAPLREFLDDPTPVIDLLDAMSEEKVRMVQRSIANNLNDISKDNPQHVIKLCKKWKSQHSGKDWMISHALRTLLKQGNIDALNLLGFSSDVNIEIKDITLTKSRIQIGEDLEFSFSFFIDSGSDLMIDYIIHFVKKNGKTGPKTFKWRNFTAEAGKEYRFSKSQSFKQMSTRKHYQGKHKIEIMVNGNILIGKEFEVFI